MKVDGVTESSGSCINMRDYIIENDITRTESSQLSIMQPDFRTTPSKLAE